MSNIKNIINNMVNDVVDDAKDELSELQEEIENDEEFKEHKKKKTTLIMIFAACCLLLLCVVSLVAYCFIATDTAFDNYITTKNQTHTDTHEIVKNQILAAGEERYHTSNEISITIDAIKKQSKLSVLDVKDIYYYTGSENNKKSDGWYKFTGTGKYEINMNFAEIIVDDERKHIFIRIPEPVLNENINIDIEQYHFEKHLFSSVGDGVNIAHEAEIRGREEIEKDLKNNLQHIECAKFAAKEQIINLVKKLNPNIDIEIQVEFF